MQVSVSTNVRRALLLAAILPFSSWGQQLPTALNPAVQKVVDGVSEERITATLHKLEGFGTRHIMSDRDNPTHGIGAAQRWLESEFKSYSPRLEVHSEIFTLKKQARVAHDVETGNVIAVLPGKVHKDLYVIVSSHYDTLAMNRPTGQISTGEESTPVGADPLPVAPGVTDDGSGVAAVLELARVMSQYEYDKSIVFVTFSAEEVGLLGSRDYAEKAKKAGQHIEAVLNNDIIGSDIAGNRRTANGVLRVFSDGPEDSPSRSLARYTKEVAERYVPSMKVDLIFRADRFGRGGDHTSFVRAGFAGVRFTTPAENYANQHTPTDTFSNTSPSYITRVAKMNGAVLASLALAPAAPETSREVMSGPRKGSRTPLLGRGKSGYDAALEWKNPNPEPDLAGYAVVIRSTTSAMWEREIFVGNATSYTMPDLSIDDVVIGVKAIDKEGNASLVSSYVAVAPASVAAGAAAQSTDQPSPATAK